MRELDDSIKAVLIKLPEEYAEMAMRHKNNADWRAMEALLSAIRERILDYGKATGRGELFHVLEGFDAVFKILDKVAGAYVSRSKAEAQLLSIRKREAV